MAISSVSGSTEPASPQIGARPAAAPSRALELQVCNTAPVLPRAITLDSVHVQDHASEGDHLLAMPQAACKPSTSRRVWNSLTFANIGKGLVGVLALSTAGFGGYAVGAKRGAESCRVELSPPAPPPPPVPQPFLPLSINAALPTEPQVATRDGLFRSDNKTVVDVEAALAYLHRSPAFKLAYEDIVTGDTPVSVKRVPFDASEVKIFGRVGINWDPAQLLVSQTMLNETSPEACGVSSAAKTFGHEIVHAGWGQKNPIGQAFLGSLSHPWFDNLEEQRAVTAENAFADELGESLRVSHRGHFAPAKSVVDRNDGLCPSDHLASVMEGVETQFGRAHIDDDVLSVNHQSRNQFHAELYRHGFVAPLDLMEPVYAHFAENNRLVLDFHKHLNAGGDPADFAPRYKEHFDRAMKTALRFHGIR